MTKRIVSGIFILTALGALGVILAGALTSGEQLIVRFLTAVIVAALGLYVISDLRLQADDDAMTARAGGPPRVGAVEAPPNSTAAFMATVTRKIDGPLAAATSALAAPDDPPPPVDDGLAASDGVFPAIDDGEAEQLVASMDADGTPVEADIAELQQPSDEDHNVAVGAAVDADQLDAESIVPVDGEIGERHDHVEEELLEAVAAVAPVETTDGLAQSPDHALAGVGAVASLPGELVANGSASNHSNGSRNGHRAPDTVREDYLHSTSVDISDLFSDHVSPPVPDIGGGADDYHSWPGQQTNTTDGDAGNGFVTPDDADSLIAPDNADAVIPAEPVEPTTDEEDHSGTTDATLDADMPAETAASEFEYSDELASTEHVWPAAPASNAPEPHPFEKASAAYEAAKRKIEAVDEPAAPTSLPVASTTELDAVSYADAPLAPIIDLREVATTEPDEVDNAIHVGEVEVIATLIEQGMLNTEGPISDREVRTMVYVAFTSNELRKLLIAGGSPDGPNHDLDLGPVELFDERRHTPAPKTLYSGIDHPQPRTKLG